MRIAPASACLDGWTFVIMGILFVYDQQGRTRNGECMYARVGHGLLPVVVHDMRLVHHMVPTRPLIQLSA